MLADLGDDPGDADVFLVFGFAEVLGEVGHMIFQAVHHRAEWVV